jgi:hypothetical protein
MTVLVEEVATPLRVPPAPDHALPAARGPVSQSIVDYVTGGRGELVDTSSGVAGQPHDEDFQAALWLVNVLQVTTFRRVDPQRVASLRMRTLHWYLEQTFEAQLRRLVPVRTPDDLLAHLRALIERPSPARTAAPDAVRRRFLAKAPYLGWEADPHTLALAHVEGPLKPSLVEIQSGEYGLGHANTHAEIYGACLGELGTDLADAVSAAPACSLAFANAAWLFGRDRRMRGAAVGQLCLLELDSVEPCVREKDCWDAAGLPEAARRWYDVHALADVEHAAVITDKLLPAVEQHTPWLVADAAWGAEVTWVLQDSVARECAG